MGIGLLSDFYDEPEQYDDENEVLVWAYSNLRLTAPEFEVMIYELDRRGLCVPPSFGWVN
jgi:hypothetical protein